MRNPSNHRARILDHIVTDESGCWIWQGMPDRDGYGGLQIEGRTWRAHRASYEMLVGPIPVGLVLDHLCRIRLCVNPEHLEPVTNHENLLRGVAARPDPETCRAGLHDWVEENIYVAPGSSNRSCKPCARAHTRQWKAARRAS